MNKLILPPHKITYLTHVILRRKISGITREKIGYVTTLVINRPEVKNKLDEMSYNELCDNLRHFDEDDTSTAAVIYGLGGNFCTGCTDKFVPDFRKLVTKKPLVAGITGYATGFGFELALLCDLRVMEETSQIGLNAFPSTMSQMAYDRLVSVVGYAYATDLALTGRNVHVKEAFQKGLVNRIVDCGTGIGQGLQLAKSIGKYPAENLIRAKEGVLAAVKR